MKKIFSILSVVASSIVFFSCQKAALALNPRQDTMTASINGTIFTSTDTNGAINIVSGGQQLSFNGKSASGQYITIAINNFDPMNGTSWTIEGGSGTAIGAYNTGVTGASDIIGTKGKAQLNGVNNTTYPDAVVYTGSFNFTAGTNIITSGEFSIIVTK